MSELKKAMKETTITPAHKGPVKSRPQGYDPANKETNPGKGFKYDTKHEVWTRKPL